MSYLLIAVPTDTNAKTTKSKLRNAIKRYGGPVNDFKIPLLKIGTLDQLMQLSDELVKVDQQGEQIVKKIERCFYDMLENKPKNEEKKQKDKDKSKKDKKKKVELTVALNVQEGPKKGKGKVVNLPPEMYVQGFRWDRLYDMTKPLPILSDEMLRVIVKADDDLKNQVSSYSDFRGALEVIERKESGTLLVKPLEEFVKKKDVVSSEHLTTLMVVIPTNSEEKFLSTYELMEKQQKTDKKNKKQDASKNEPEVSKDVVRDDTKQIDDEEIKETAEEKAERLEQEKADREKEKQMEIERKKQEKLDKLYAMCENVVPKSAKKLASETDFVLYRVVIFRKGEENLKRLMRQERYTIRQFQYDPNANRLRKEQKKRLKEKRRTAWNSVVRWCKVYFERTFKLWMHIKALRCFVEAILRYGLPPDFQSYLISYNKNKLDSLRSALKALYANLGNKTLLEEEEDDSENIVTTGMIGLSGDFHPYVSLDINLQNE